jgi:hypothetical protein
MNWARMLAYITGTVDQELLLRNEYLVPSAKRGRRALITVRRRDDNETPDRTDIIQGDEQCRADGADGSLGDSFNVTQVGSTTFAIQANDRWWKGRGL